MGSGEEHFVLEDPCCGSNPFNQDFSFSFSVVAVDQRGFVASHFNVRSGIGVWNPKLRRNLNDWELDDLMGLLGLLNVET